MLRSFILWLLFVLLLSLLKLTLLVSCRFFGRLLFCRFFFLSVSSAFTLVSFPFASAVAFLFSSFALFLFFLFFSLCRLFWRLLSFCLFLFLVGYFSSFSSVSWSLPLVVFLRLSSGWSSLPRPSLSSHPLSSSVSATGTSVPTASVVSGVASSALGGGSDGSSSRGIFSVAAVPEIHSVFFFFSLDPLDIYG